ncbi:MAG: ATP-binding protein [Negativicutes bacterium]|nr:ATP-binding protein [Negativicutes bacterium]
MLTDGEIAWLMTAVQRLLRGDYRAVSELSGGPTSGAVGNLAEMVALLAVKLEAREYELQEALAELTRVNGRLSEELSDREQRLQEAITRVRHSERLAIIGKLAAGVAHEISTPLAAILATTGDLLANRQQLAEKLTDICRDVTREGQELFVSEMADILSHEKTRLTLDEEEGRRWEIENCLYGMGVPGPQVPIYAGVWSRLGRTVQEIKDRQLQITAGELLRPVEVVSELLNWYDGVRDVAAAARQIEAIVRSLRGYCQLVAGRTKPVNLVDTLGAAVKMVRQLREKRCRIRVDCDRRLAVVGHRELLVQVWLNLLVNAVQATADGGEIRVKCRRDDGQILLRFIDNGAGIDPAIAGQVFEPFFTTRDGGQGCGLGLDFCRQIVLAHSGTIDFTSRPGHTEFRVRLPVGQQPGEQEEI